ncbi:MAG: 5-bromo-4-chloroindolyl phosphate hydrolysis family protein [Gemmobacter sp.]
MAQRYGGPHSPGTARGSAPGTGGPLATARPGRSAGRVNALFLAPFAFIVTAFLQPPAGLALDLVAWAVLMLAAWLTREGERAHEAWESRSVARRPAIPRKAFAAVLSGLGIAVGAFVPGQGAVAPVLLGLIGAGLHLVAFGPDPMRDKGMEGIDRTQTERVARAIDEAERHLATLRETARRTGDRQIADAADRFIATARGMFRTIENDPRDLTPARRYLSVYLQGARDATVRYADLTAQRPDPQARAAYLELLNDLDSRFAQRTEALLGNDRTNLDVEIEVLRERLAQDAPLSR